MYLGCVYLVYRYLIDISNIETSITLSIVSLPDLSHYRSISLPLVILHLLLYLFIFLLEKKLYCSGEFDCCDKELVL